MLAMRKQSSMCTGGLHCVSLVFPEVLFTDVQFNALRFIPPAESCVKWSGALRLSANHGAAMQRSVLLACLLGPLDCLLALQVCREVWLCHFGGGR